MANRDMTQKQFDAALARYGLRHEGEGAWNEGTYRVGAYSIPVNGLFGTKQLDVRSRRALLKDLIQHSERQAQQQRRLKAVRCLKRGDRVVLTTFIIRAPDRHMIVVQPVGADGKITVSGRGLRNRIAAEKLAPYKKGPWGGPQDLATALAAEAARLRTRLRELDEEIAGAVADGLGVAPTGADLALAQDRAGHTEPRAPSREDDR